MKLWVISDLHLEHRALEITGLPDADVCIVAGDVLTKGVVPSVQWLGGHIARHMPVVFVAGNHEHYGGFIDQGIENGRAAAREFPGMHFGENECWEFEDIVFIGATLWTDFELMGSQEIAMSHAQRVMTDYRAINYSKRPFSRLSPFHTLRRHRESLTFIEHALKRKADRKRIVVTHHAPSGKSVPDRYKNDLTSAAFASNLDEVVTLHRPEVWIHGHIHQKTDYMLGDTQVVANPRGYPGEPCFEDFDPLYVIDV